MCLFVLFNSRIKSRSERKVQIQTCLVLCQKCKIFQVNSAAKLRNIDFRQTSPVFGLQRCVKGKITVQFVDRLLTASMLDISDQNGGGDLDTKS